MAHADFVHLRVHSAYSLSEGAIKIKDLVSLCRRQNMPAVAVTDSGNLFGALEFSLAAAAAGVQPIIGCQIAVTRSDPGADSTLGGRGGLGPAKAETATPDELVLLVQNEVGYRNLLEIVSASYLESEPDGAPQVGLERLEGRCEGLIALTAGPKGAVGRLLAERRDEWAEGVLLVLSRLFPGRLYVEIQRHGLEREAAIEEALIDLAYKHEIPLVATNDVYFADRSMHEAHEALLCIAGGTYLSQTDRRQVSPEHGFKPATDMRKLFQDLPEAVDNTLVVAQRCAFYPQKIDPILPAFPTEAGRSEGEELRAQAEAGLRLRLEAKFADGDPAEREALEKPYWDRLAYELGVIAQMGFPGYFLIVADFIQWAKRAGIPVGPGRGSGAASVVAWSLTITDLDPLRWGLVFERFLNPERVSMPDFDIDFCQDRRDEVIQYVKEKYGDGRVAQIITFGKLQARAVLRDVGRVLQMPYGQVDRICKLVPNNPANPVTLSQAIEGEPMLQQMREEDLAVARLIDIALKLEGLFRHASTHAAGIVIGDRPLQELVALYRDPRADLPATQFNMKYVEQAGLVKFDFLGLKTLSVIDRACQLIRESESAFDIERIPLDDGPTYEMLGRAESVGVFQLESSGMRDVLRQLKADRFEDIIALVALYRPGPMDNIPSYINRKHGREEADYLYPSLEGILKETYGIMIYQEQVQQIAQELSGYTLGGADLLRRAMGKKIKAEMEAQRKTFIEGAEGRGVPGSKASEIFEQVNKFAGYGFNKAHAAAYALVAYQTGYLKAHYPVEFLAASMTYDMGNTDKLNIFRQELDRLGIPLLPPDVNRSKPDFAVERSDDGTKGIRYALAAIKNVGGAAMDALVQDRESQGPFATLSELARRLDGRAINKRQIENLACAGALDGLNGNRRQLYEGADVLVRHAAAAAQERESTQESLFGGDQSFVASEIILPAVEDWPSLERLRYEFDAIGFYLSSHPLETYGDRLQKIGVTSYAELNKAGAGDSGLTKLAGIVLGKQERTSRQGNRFAFIQASDMSGSYEVVIFSETLSRCRELFDSAAPLVFTVEARRDGGDLRLTAQHVEPLEAVISNSLASLRLFLKDPSPLPAVKSVLSRDGGAKGQGRISLILDLTDGQEVEMELNDKYRLTPQLCRAIKSIPGVTAQEV